MSYSVTRLQGAALAGVLLFACAPANDPIVVPEPDKHQFATQVYPILLRDCGFPECHGADGRFFRIYGPGRQRILLSTLPEDPATDQEIAETYNRTRSMLTGEEDPLELLLLRKPLAKAAGGSEHKGEDDWGRNVYLSTDDPSWKVIAAWALASVGPANGQVPVTPTSANGGTSP